MKNKKAKKIPAGASLKSMAFMAMILAAALNPGIPWRN
jgi:hypothetical protein